MKKFLKELAKRNAFFAFLIKNLLFIKNRNKVDPQIISTMKEYLSDKEFSDKKRVNKITKDLLYLKSVRKETFYCEYFFYRLENKSFKEFNEYVFRNEHNRNCLRVLKTDEIKQNHFLRNKLKTYERLGEFFNRDVISISNFQDYEKFKNFVSAHHQFIIKPSTGSMGRNIYVGDVDKNDINLRNLFLSYVTMGECIVEEYVVQEDFLRSINPNTVNTVRLVSYYDGKNVKYLFSMFRSGCGDALVDNVCQGGMCACIDIATGRVITDGFRKNGEEVKIHPNSNIKIKGIQIPQWQQLLDMVAKMAPIAQPYKYIGWDLALSNKGWVLIEANSRPDADTYQMCRGSGIRKQLKEVGLAD